VRDDSLLVPAVTVFAILVGMIAWPFVAIVIHELGHTTAGKLFGLVPTHFIVGYPDEQGNPLLSFRAFGCAIELWPLPFGGATFFRELPTDDLKMFIVVVAGPLMDILVIFVCTLIWHYSFIRVGLFFIIVSQSLDMLCNLIPRSFLYDGVRVPNDSKIILQLLAGRRRT
jgi:hypothetical protein